MKLLYNLDLGDDRSSQKAGCSWAQSHQEVSQTRRPAELFGQLHPQPPPPGHTSKAPFSLKRATFNALGIFSPETEGVLAVQVEGKG